MPRIAPDNYPLIVVEKDHDNQTIRLTTNAVLCTIPCFMGPYGRHNVDRTGPGADLMHALTDGGGIRGVKAAAVDLLWVVLELEFSFSLVAASRRAVEIVRAHLGPDWENCMVREYDTEVLKPHRPRATL
jgi:hypothetical protein